MHLNIFSERQLYLTNKVTKNVEMDI